MKKETADEIVGRALRGEPYVPTGDEGVLVSAQPAAPQGAAYADSVLEDVAALRVKAVQACANANGRDWEFMYSGHQDEQVGAWLDGYSAGYTAADTATASAQGFRDGVASVSANAGEPWTGDPMDWPLPCDLTAGGVTISKGCPLRTVQTRLKVQSEANALLIRGRIAASPTAQAEGVIAEQALRKVLAAVQRYMPPDGPDAKDTLSEIIAIVDPWPLGQLEKS